MPLRHLVDMIEHWVKIDINKVIVDGKQIEIESCEPNQLLHAVYRSHIGSYPKFHKMDPLCKLGFVASELLLDAEGRREEEWGESRGVVLFNSSSSLADDSNYQKTIEGEDAFPSPSLFVYTLPNVVTGEICIRNHYYGESNFMVLPRFDEKQISQLIVAAFADPSTKSLVTGWVECWNEGNFEALMFVVDRESAQQPGQLDSVLSNFKL